MVLHADTSAPAAARAFVDDALAGAPEELRGRVRQVATELVTNSLCHAGGGDITLEVRAEAGGAADIVVRDDGAGFDVASRAAGEGDAAGWGLTLVGILADAWDTGGPGAPWVGAHFEPRAERAGAETPAEQAMTDRIRELLDVRLVLDSVKDHGIVAVDPQGRITLWNAGAERLTGYAPADVLGETLALLAESEPDAVTEQHLAAVLAHGRTEHEYWARRKDGSRFWAECVITPMYDGAARLRGFTQVMRDVTWRKRLDEDRDGLLRRIQELARTDELTGLPNRRRWQEELDRELARARRRRQTLCVAMIDLDGLKELNDTQGHLAGDDLLRRTAGAWSDALRATDMLARYGGDEFSAILPDCGVDKALVVIERLRAATPAPATCSAGVAQGTGVESAEVLIERADAALYRAKRDGRNAVAAAPP